MTDEVRAAKAALRASALLARQGRDAATRHAAGRAIAGAAPAAWRRLPMIAAFLSVGSEPPTSPLLDELAHAGVQLIVPVIDGDRLDWGRYRGDDEVAAGPLGINEPIGERLGVDAIREASLVLVPALLVDHAGHRLGRGRGYYDRALVDVAAPIVAVGYDDELVAHVPTEPHDRDVAGVLTPTGFTPLPVSG